MTKKKFKENLRALIMYLILQENTAIYADTENALEIEHIFKHRGMRIAYEEVLDLIDDEKYMMNLLATYEEE